MQTFEYINSSGQRQTTQAADANSALSSAQNIAPNSGVMLSQTPQQQPQIQQEAQHEAQQPTAEKSIADLYGMQNTPQDDFINKGMSKFGGSFDREVDEESIRRNTLRMFQAEIDTINQLYGQKMEEARFEGQGRLGSQRAIAARSGLLGSDFGASQKEKVTGYNKQITDSVAAEQAAKIASIMGFARESAAKEIAAEREALKGDRDTYIQFLQAQTERKGANLKNLAARMYAEGVDMDNMSQDDLAALAQSFGASPDEIFAEFNAVSTQAEAAKREAQIQQQTIDNQQAMMSKPFEAGGYRYQYNQETGQYDMLGTKYEKPTGGGSNQKYISINGRTYVQNPDGSLSNPQLPGGTIDNLSPRAIQALNNPALLKDYTPTERGAILDEIANGGIQAQTAGQQSALNISKRALDTLEELLDNKGGLRSASGLPGPGMLIRGSDGRQFVNKLETLQSQLELPNLEFLAGMGRMSQEQFRTLQNASHSLNRKNLSNSAMTAELQKVQQALSGYISEASQQGPGGLPQDGTYQSQSGNTYQLPY